MYTDVLAKRISSIKQKAANARPKHEDASVEHHNSHSQADQQEQEHPQVVDSVADSSRIYQSPYLHQAVYITSNHKQQAQHRQKQPSNQDSAQSPLPSIHSHPSQAQPHLPKLPQLPNPRGNRWVQQAAYAYDEDSGCFSSYEVQAKRLVLLYTCI